MARSRTIRRAFLHLVLALTAAAPAAAETVRLSEVRVEVSGNPFTPEETRSLVPFKPGDTVERADVAKTLAGIESLEAIGRVEFELRPASGGGYVLAVRVAERRIVRQILIGGNYPFLNKDFQRLLPLQPGSPYDPALLDECARSIERFLVKHGYYGSRITVTPRPHERENTVDIRVNIRKGKTYRVGEIFVTGNTKLRANFIRNKFNRLAHFSPARLKSALGRIRKAYVRRGYIKARVRTDRVVLDDGRGRADVYLSVVEGKRLRLKFEGIAAFRRGRLKQILDFSARRAYDRYSLRLGRRRLETHFRDNGYPDARVEMKIRKKPDEIVVTYVVAKGRGVELSKIRFEGNAAFSAKKLKKRISSRESKLLTRGLYRPKRLARDAARLKRFYREKGYLDAEVGAPEISSNRIGDHKYAGFPVKEGHLYRLRRIVLSGDGLSGLAKILREAGLKAGEPLTREAVDRGRTAVYEHLFAGGYAYAEVAFATETGTGDGAADVVVTVTKGARARVRSVTVKGAGRTSRKVIAKNIKIRSGEPFVHQRVLDAQQNLRRLDVFSTVRVDMIGYEERSEDVDVVFTVNELKTHVLKMQAGFDNRNLGRGELSYTKRNLFGLAKQFNARLIAGKKFDRAEATFLSPRIFGASWNLANQAFAQFEDAPNFNARSYGVFANTLKNFGPYWTVGFKEDVTNTDVIEGDSDVALLGDSLFDNTFNQLGAFVIYDRRDNFADPRRGFYVLLREELNTDLGDLKNTFNTVNANMSHHYGFWERFTLNNTLRYGHNLKIAVNPRIPVNKLFFLGGADTLRGFSEDAVDRSGGTFFLLYNAELHFRLADPVKLAGFFDAGVLSDNVNELVTGDFREAAGVGLRYFTPIGPLRLDWGFALDRRGDEPAGRVHFSFGAFF